MIMKQGADTLKRVHFELGGKNPVIVFDDADLDRALDAAIFMIYSLNGERCTSSSRLLVQDTIADTFEAKLIERVNSIQVGHPLDPAKTEIGPLIHKTHFDKVTSYFDIAREDGATIAAGGEAVGEAGWFVRPTLFTGADNTMRIAQEEIFGPVLTSDPLLLRGGGAADRQRHPLRPDRLCLDQRPDPGAALHRPAGGRHDLGELGKRPPPADPLRRRQGERHRPRRRRLVLRLLHGTETHRTGHRRAQDRLGA